MQYNIVETTTRFEKDGKTWRKLETTTKTIDKEQYYDTIDSKHAFIKLGGKEMHKKNYTALGYVVTEIHSMSPNKLTKTLREYDITRIQYKWNFA